MRHYTIYLMEDEVARSFFGQEILLYKLFLKGQANVSPQQTIIKRQIDYITKSVPVLNVHMNLKEKLHHTRGYKISCKHIIEYEESRAELTIHYNQLRLLGWGPVEAEISFFEALRQIEPCFFAMDFQNHNFGWLNPIRTKKTV